jgi:hypothetical protein
MWPFDVGPGHSVGRDRAPLHSDGRHLVRPILEQHFADLGLWICVELSAVVAVAGSGLVTSSPG